MVVPRTLRALVAVTIQTCVVGSGRGGFSTMGIERLFNYLRDPNPSTSPYIDPIPDNTAFITATVHGINLINPTPGDQDPSVPLALSSLFGLQASLQTEDSHERYISLMESALYLGDASGQPGDRAWWDRGSTGSETAQKALLASDEMIYECNSRLGSPSSVYCSQIEWSQLGPPSDMLALDPSSPTILHQEDCYLAITATVALALTWRQIRAAIDTLLNTCVNHPYNPPQGGRAYFGTLPYLSAGHGKRDTVSGLNALPPHANITVFQQNATACTWKAEGDGVAVVACNAA
ncbi:hypothetical protein MMC14_002487 [Varicellaria rhodocarpa]|nr:hypothetical protein [Varicellaria rhodocarpa]